MKKTKPILILLLLIASAVDVRPQSASPAELAKWRQRAEGINIIRDDGGVAHVYGKRDADVIFGMMYAQGEDAFNRVETNYLTNLGRAAEADGESRIWQDVRQRLFIDPVE